jgi:hypothetical protein
MVNKATEQDLENLAKIKRLRESAISAREKAMYESLLQKAEQQIAKVKDSETVTKVEAKKGHNRSHGSKKAVVAAEEIVPRHVDDSSLKESVSEELPPEKKEATSGAEVNVAMFQAIGVIESVISVTEKSQLRISLGNQKYRLGYTAKSRERDYAKLLSEISSQGSKIQKISVYPQVKYNPKKEGDNRTYEISFNLVSVEKPSAKENQKIAGIFEHLAVGEFQISGYWQYVALCNCPCITVMRNYSESLAQRVLKVGHKKASRWLQPHHIPVEWVDSSPEPFKYDSNLEQQEQMPRLFVQTKVRFEPESKKFMVIEELDQARTQAPRYLKSRGGRIPRPCLPSTVPLTGGTPATRS